MNVYALADRLARRDVQHDLISATTTTENISGFVIQFDPERTSLETITQAINDMDVILSITEWSQGIVFVAQKPPDILSAAASQALSERPRRPYRPAGQPSSRILGWHFSD